MVGSVGSWHFLAFVGHFPYLGQVVALHAYYVHTAHAEAGILTQEYLLPVW